MNPAVPTTQSLQTLSDYIANLCDDEEKRAVCQWHGRQIGGGACSLYYSHPNLSVPTEIPFTDLRARNPDVLSDQQYLLQGADTAELDAESVITEAIVENKPVVATHSCSGVSQLKKNLQKELYLGSGCERLGSKVATKRLINEAVNRFFKTVDLDGVRPEHSANKASPLLNEFTKSEAGERLYRKAVAANLVQLERFVRIAGVNINNKCPKTGNTPLLTAVLYHRWEMVATLLKAGASATVKNRHGNHLVVMLFQKWFEERLSVAVHIGLIINMLSTQSRHQILKRDLFEPLGAFTFTMSAYCGNVQLCRAILQAFPDLADDFRHNQVIDKTLMNVVSGSTHISSVPALLRVVRYLVTLEDQKGNRLVNVKTTTRDGETFLMRAVLKGDYSIVAELLDDPGIRGTINAQTFSEQKWTAYTYAHQKKKSDIMRLLVRNGALECKAPKSSRRNGQEEQGRGTRSFSCFS